jgi:hypothetical protein
LCGTPVKNLGRSIVRRRSFGEVYLERQTV